MPQTNSAPAAAIYLTRGLPRPCFCDPSSATHRTPKLGIRLHKIACCGSRREQTSNTVDGLNWQSIHDVALRDRQFRLALPPTNSISGLAACMSAAAAYHQLPTLERSLVDDGDFQRWLADMLEAVPNRNLNPRDQLNSRPPQADVGLLMNSELQQLDEERFDADPPIYNVVLDYPYFIRTEWPRLSASTANAHQVASERFRDFLIDSPQQAKLGEYGFEPAVGNDNGQSVEIDGSTLGALRGCWR